MPAREVLVRIRVKLENEIRGLLRTFGVLFGKAAGGFAQRAPIQAEGFGGDLRNQPITDRGSYADLYASASSE